jgi:hypothetical protein
VTKQGNLHHESIFTGSFLPKLMLHDNLAKIFYVILYFVHLLAFCYHSLYIIIMCFNLFLGQGVAERAAKDNGCTLCTDEAAADEDNASSAIKCYPWPSV